MRRLVPIAASGVLVAAALLAAAASPASAALVVSGQRYEISNDSAGECLGITGSSANPGAAAVLGDCVNTPTLRWHVIATTTVGGVPGYVQLQNDLGDRCLGVSGGSQAGGAAIVQGPCGPTSDHSQFWLPISGDHLQNGHSGKCMGTKGSADTIGTPVVQGTCNALSITQGWSFEPV